MFPISRHASALLLGLVLLSPAAAADERKQVFQPQNAMEYWAAMRFEISVGKYDIAASYLKGFLEKMPTDEELLKLEEQEGMSAFLKLLTIPETRKLAGPLLERVSQVVKQVRSDPARIQKFVRNLSATPEERIYALNELRKSGAIVIPYLVDLLRDVRAGDSHVAILLGLLKLNRDTVPPLVAALDLPEPQIRAELIQTLQERGDPSVVPSLWYLAASPRQPEIVRRRAAAAIAALVDAEPGKLPSAKEALVKEAERYLSHKVKFLDPAAVTVWQWDSMNQKLTVPPPTMTQTQAEEYYGLRFARQALDLDPTYRPAQIVFLTLALEKAYERAGIDQPLEKGSPTIKDLLRSVNSTLLIDVLERGLTEHRLPVILATVRALGDLTDVRAARLKVGQAPALVKALNYPDRRVQLAAAEAILGIPGPPPPQSSGRVVEILRRAVAAEATPKVVLGDANRLRAQEVSVALKQVGFEPLTATNGRDVMNLLAEAADVDLIFIDSELPDPGLNFLVAQLRADVDSGLLPLFITVSPDRSGRHPALRELQLKDLAKHYRNTWVIKNTLDPELLKTILPERITQAMGKLPSAEERAASAAEAMVWLKRIATGERPGFDVRPAQNVILRALDSPTLRPLAIEAMRGLPGAVPQRELAAQVLKADLPPELRSLAAIELNRHVQQHGMLLDRANARAIVDLLQTVQEPKLKSNVALVVGSMRPTARRTGTRLQGYNPPPPMPMAPEEKEPPKPKEKEKEKDDKKEDKEKEKE